MFQNTWRSDISCGSIQQVAGDLEPVYENFKCTLKSVCEMHPRIILTTRWHLLANRVRYLLVPVEFLGLGIDTFRNIVTPEFGRFVTDGGWTDWMTNVRSWTWQNVCRWMYDFVWWISRIEGYGTNIPQKYSFETLRTSDSNEWISTCIIIGMNVTPLDPAAMFANVLHRRWAVSFERL